MLIWPVYHLKLLSIYLEIKSDMDALMAGRKQEQNNHSVFHVIRIGRKYAGYPTKISKQTKIIDGAKTLITQPPQLRHLRAMQRDFVGKLQPFLMDVIVDNDDAAGAAATAAAALPLLKRPPCFVAGPSLALAARTGLSACHCWLMLHGRPPSSLLAACVPLSFCDLPAVCCRLLFSATNAFCSSVALPPPCWLPV